MTLTNKPNHLINEPSAYLQQHAHNPVDWYPWCDEALAKARRENKPILLSIGYAACHWCHIMAHESFEDEETARLMNALFINIKVDREERPDLDKICQTAHGILAQRGGGWPLTVFLTPEDLMPFFCGTYFPLQARYNLPAFKYVLRNIADLYAHHRGEIDLQNKELQRVLTDQHPQSIAEVTLSSQPIEMAKDIFKKRYDAQNGGFGTAPKFPQTVTLEFLLQDREIVCNTLQHMAAGGIYDQLAGGFFRYSVDAAWRIPHFEKMLYDNAELLRLYAVAYRMYKAPEFLTIAATTGHWLLQTMQFREGGFYASLDADSEGQEGHYYLWNKLIVKQLLTADEYEVAIRYFGLQGAPNFAKQWHLYIAHSLTAIGDELKLPVESVRDLMQSAKAKLLAAREGRVPPADDKKILTAWNALALEALFIAGDSLGEKTFIQAAEHTLALIYHKLWINGRLFVSYQNGQSRFAGYLDDYAFLLNAVLASLTVSWSTKYYEFAIALADSLLHHFMDKKHGGFYFTADDHEKLTYRPKSMTDEALPSGNGIAARALTLLGHLTGDVRYSSAAEGTLMAAWEMMSRYPAEHSSLLLALNDFLNPVTLVILRGPRETLAPWHECCKQYPSVKCFAIPNEERSATGLLAERPPTDRPTAYVCQGTQCLPNIEDLAELEKTLGPLALS